MFNWSIFSTRNHVGTIRISEIVIYQMDNVEIDKGNNISSYSPEIESGVYFVAADFGSEQKVIRFSVAK